MKWDFTTSGQARRQNQPLDADRLCLVVEEYRSQVEQSVPEHVDNPLWIGNAIMPRLTKSSMEPIPAEAKADLAAIAEDSASPRQKRMDALKGAIKNLIGREGLTRCLARSTEGTIIVLMYHDVCSDSDFSSWLRVKESNFRVQMKSLQTIGRFISPDALFQARSSAGLFFLLTFDDGFTNNCSLVLPVLKAFGIPAVFFVSTDNVQSGASFWFDKVVTPIQVNRISSLDMRDVGLKRYRFDMTDEESRWDDIQCLLSDIKEAAGQAKSAEERILRYFENNFRDVQTGANLKYRPLTTNQIRTMTESHWCHFGSHSHRHEILTNLDDRELKENLAESKTFLESVLGEPICHISYPDGAADARVLARCGEAGYKYGYLAAGGCVGPHTDPLMIPRIGVGGYDSLRSLYTKINGALLDAILSRLNG